MIAPQSVLTESPCNGCATVVESGRAEGLQWLDGSRYYPTRTNRRIDRRLHPTVADVWILTEAESLSSELVQQLFAQILTHHPYASLW